MRDPKLEAVLHAAARQVVSGLKELGHEGASFVVTLFVDDNMYTASNIRDAEQLERARRGSLASPGALIANVAGDEAS